MTDLAATLAELLAQVTRGRVDEKSLAAATPLDLVSVEVLELVVGIEDRLGVELRGEDVAAENLATFGQLVALVEARCRT